MIHRFAEDFWIRKHTGMQSSEFSSLIAQVLRGAAASEDGIYEATGLAENADHLIPLLDERDESAHCRHLENAGVVFTPQGYEPNYAYPLMINLDAEQEQSGENRFQEFMQGLSDRNYLGLKPDGKLASELGRLTQFPPVEMFEKCETALTLLRTVVGQLRKKYNIHTERIFLAGTGNRAELALTLFLAQPEWFGGVVLLNGTFSGESTCLKNIEDLREKRVFLAVQPQPEESPSQTEQTFVLSRLLHTAGLDVTTRVYEQGQTQLPSILSDANHWAMGHICTLV
ncbi:MAG: hypothetical protein Tsb009_08030 [Planctomycetaceae bacterium]